MQRSDRGIEFKYASLCDNTEILEAAFSAAKPIVSSDPTLEKEENLALAKFVLDKVSVSSSTIS